MKIKEGIKRELEFGYSVGQYDLTLEISKYMTVLLREHDLYPVEPILRRGLDCDFLHKRE